MRISTILLCICSLMISVPYTACANNLSLERRADDLEQDLNLTQRQLEVALTRTRVLLDRIAILEKNLRSLQNQVDRLVELASPGPPSDFRVERVKKGNEGYEVFLRWSSNPSHDEVEKYEIWCALKGQSYVEGWSVNATNKQVVRTQKRGFEEGQEIVFKIFARNEAGRGLPSYDEMTIRSYNPRMVRAIIILGLLLITTLSLVYLKREEIRDILSWD